MNVTPRLSQSSLLLDDIRNNYQNDSFYSKVIQNIDKHEPYFLENSLLYTGEPYSFVICMPQMLKLIQAILSGIKWCTWGLISKIGFTFSSYK